MKLGMTGSEDSGSADVWLNCLNSLNLIMTLAGTRIYVVLKCTIVYIIIFIPCVLLRFDEKSEPIPTNVHCGPDISSIYDIIGDKINY